MFARTMTNRMKAAAIAALMCLSVAASTVTVMTKSSLDVSAAAVTIDSSLAVEGTYKGYTGDIAASGIKTITFTCKADFTGNFSYGFGIGTAASPYWYEWDGKGWVDTKGGTIEVPGVNVPVTEGENFTITIDTSKLDLKYKDEYNSKYDGTYELRNYYTSVTGGKITVVSAEANASTTTPTTEPTTSTTEPTTGGNTTDTTEPATTEPGTSAGTLNEKLGVKDTFIGYWADYAASGIKNVAITFTADFTGTVNFGMGIGTAATPYWYEWDAATESWVDTKGGTIEVDGTSAAVEEGKSYTVVFDTSKYELSYNPKTDEYPGHFEFRNNYVSETGGSITVTGVEVNTTKTSDITAPEGDSGTGKDEHKLAIKDGQHSVNNVSGQGFKFVDNGDGTGTMTATQARQLEFPDAPYVLTRGYDEEYYTLEGIEWTEGTDPINSHKFAYSDFGLMGIGEGLTIESLTATITSDVDVKNFMYGGGLNVDKNSPADTESAKAAAGVAADENAGYWYNDMGEDKIEEYESAGVDFNGFTPNYGYYLSNEDNQLGQYFSVIWDVPADVKQYERNGEISFQYWYGVEDGEFENYEDSEIDTVNLIGGLVTYTEERTFKYSDTASAKVGAKLVAGDDTQSMGGLSYAEILGDDAPNATVGAVVFNLTTTADLDKLVYAVGTSVGDDFKMYASADAGDKWDYVATNTSKGTVQIAWIVPDGLNINEEYGDIKFGYWYGGQGETTLDSITLDSIDVYYYAEEPETTEPTTEPLTPLYGDVDCDGKVNVVDVLTLNKNLLGLETLSEQGKLNADVDISGGAPDATDSLNILKYCVKLITSLPV